MNERKHDLESNGKTMNNVTSKVFNKNNALLAIKLTSLGKTLPTQQDNFTNHSTYVMTSS